LQEVLEINKRKEDELQTKNTEIEGLYKRLRDYLIIQDQLYKDYVRAEALTTKMKEEMNQKIRNATDNWHEEEMKVEKLQRLVQELRANLPE
jgi:selenocysteine lyase/cysteine desulfurase